MRLGFARPVLAALAVGASLAVAGHAGVTYEPNPFPFSPDLAGGPVGIPTIVTTSDGTPHVLHTGPDRALLHAWRQGGRWRREEVSPGYALCTQQSLAAGSDGSLHAAFELHSGTWPDINRTVMYAVRAAGRWTLTEIAPGSGAVLLLGADDLPRIVFDGTDGPRVAAFDGASWSIGEFGPPAPDSFRTMRLLRDATGHLHALTLDRDGWAGEYATDATGEWVQEEGFAETLALDPAGWPHLIIYGDSGDPEAWDRMVHRWFDGTEWRNEDVLEFGLPFRLRGYSNLVADAAGRLFLLYFHIHDRRYGDPPTIRLAVRDALGWRDLHVARAYSSLPLPPALAPDGALHAIWFGGYARVALPDLAVDAEGLGVESRDGAVRVAGRLLVSNRGAGRSPASRVRFFVSDDDFLDEGDEPFGSPRSVPSLGPGKAVRIPLDLRIPGPVAGERLLAVVRPAGRLPDLDRTNDGAAIPLGE